MRVNRGGVSGNPKPWVVKRFLDGHSDYNTLDGSHLCGQGHNGCVCEEHITWETRKVNLSRRMCHIYATCPGACHLTFPVSTCSGHEGSEHKCLQVVLRADNQDACLKGC